MIAAAGENNALGMDNQLLWHLPDDFRRFRKLTTGHKMIMGRKTFESFPKPLPDRDHIIITRDPDYSIDFESCKTVHSFEAALDLLDEDETAYIIGGGEIYRLGMPYAHILELTRVHGDFKADTFFPEIDTNTWRLIKEEYHPKDEKHAFDFTYLTYERSVNSGQ